MHSLKQVTCIILALVLVFSLFTGCAKPAAEKLDAPAEAAAAATAEAPQLAETVVEDVTTVAGVSDETLTIALSAEPKVTDGIYGMGQQASVIAYSIYDGLVEWNSEKQQYDPKLAESWEQIDECTIRFHLRQDVTFHDGEPFTTADVMWNFNNVKENSSAAASYIKNFDIDNFKVIDDYTIDIVTFEPYILTMTVLSLNYFLMMSPTTVEKIGGEEHTRTPFGGSGAYKFVEWVAGSYIMLERNENYYGELPYYKNLKIVFIADDTARGLALESGDVDIAENVLESQALEYMKGTDISVYVPAKITAYALWFNHREGRATKELAVRQAIAYAIDPTGLPELLNMPSSAASADGMQPVESTAYRAPADGNYAQDLEKAAALLAEAGYADGLELTMFYPEGTIYATLAEYIQYALGQINVNVTLESIAQAASRERQSSGEYDMYLQRTSVYDPNISGIQWFYTGVPTNMIAYSNAEFDAASDKCYGTVDEAAFNESLMNVCDLIRADLPAYYLIHTTNLFAFKSGLTGIYTEKMLCGIYTHVRPVA